MPQLVPGQGDHSNTAVWPDDLARPELPNDDKLRALRWARSALSEARSRCSRNNSDAFIAWTAAVEGVWWALALDESLALLIGKKDYAELRDSDRHGRVVAGFRWIRNRHAHELYVTGAGGPKRPFYSQPGDNYVFYISPVNRWKKAEEIRADHDGDKTGDRKRAYDDHVAGMSLDMSLEWSMIWFNRVFDAWGVPESVPVDDPTILR